MGRALNNSAVGCRVLWNQLLELGKDYSQLPKSPIWPDLEICSASVEGGRTPTPHCPEYPRQCGPALPGYFPWVLPPRVPCTGVSRCDAHQEVPYVPPVISPWYDTTPRSGAPATHQPRHGSDTLAEHVRVPRRRASTRILGRRTAPFPPFLIPSRVPHGFAPRS